MGLCGLEMDAEESVSVESDESIRCDWSRFPGKNFASLPADLEEIGVFSPSAVGVVGVRPSTGARRSSSSASSSSEERASWKAGAPALERIVPIPSVWNADEQAKRERISIRDSREERKQWMASIGLRLQSKCQRTPWSVGCSEA